MADSDTATNINHSTFGSHEFHDTSNFFFYHTINVEEGTLRVQVLGPNLTFTFRHERRARSFSSTSLANKTAGFLVIVGGQPSGATSQRRIIAWAQSGHGLGSSGDSLIPGPFVLRNRFWAKRTKSMAELLGMASNHPYDRTGLHGEERRGTFHAAHVEVKLATHAIFVLLQVFGISHDPRNITLDTLASLAHCRFPTGAPPVVEIYFSRKNCGHCGRFLTRLEIATGLRFNLIWRHRLVRMEFANEVISYNPDVNQPAAIEDIDSGDEASSELSVIEVGSPVPISDDEDAEDDSPSVTEIKEMLEIIDLTAASTSNAAITAQDLVSFLDGVTYAVGQHETAQESARAAALDLAHGLRNQRARARRRSARSPLRANAEQRTLSTPPNSARRGFRNVAVEPRRRRSRSPTMIPEFLRSPPTSPSRREIAARNARERRGRVSYRPFALRDNPAEI